MERLEGIHFYICIQNFNQIIIAEEEMDGKVTRALHALDTFFTSIERFGRSRFPKSFTVEKITGARLHLYVTDELLPAFQVVKAVSAYAILLAKSINSDIPKYQKLLDLTINIGAAFGKFYSFEFTSKDGLSESTTIGYAANYAAKLQALSRRNEFSISEDIFEALPPEEQKNYSRQSNPSIRKYGQEQYYSLCLEAFESSGKKYEKELNDAKEYATSDNLKDIAFSNVKARLNFRDLSRTQCKKLEGIPVFADIRGFTSQFSEDDSNLTAMAKKTQQILETMYDTCTEMGGIHIQFQGDRELALFQKTEESTDDSETNTGNKCFKNAVLAAMRMIDAIKPYHVHIGVGEAFGKLFATKIGMRGEKDNLLLGETIIQADRMEDQKAGEDQIAITEDAYAGLLLEDSYLAGKFRQAGNAYIATIGYREYLGSVSSRMKKTNTSSKNYNGAWGEKL